MGVEIRPLLDTAAFGDAFTPELAEQEERLRERIAGADASAGPARSA